MNAPRPDWYTVEAFQNYSANIPARFLARARVLVALNPALSKGEHIYYACTPIEIPAPFGQSVTEYRHELQVSPTLHALMLRMPTARLQPDRQPFTRR